jgi:hypothetical protein
MRPPHTNDVAVDTKRLKNESPQAYEAFRCYLDLGPERSIRAVVRKLGKSRALLDRWSQKNKWQARLVVHHSEQADIAKEATATAELEFARKQAARKEQVQATAWDIAQQLIAKAREMLDFPLSEREVTQEDDNGNPVAITIKPVGWRLRDAATLAEVADALSRISLGMPSKVTGLTGPDGGQLPAASGDPELIHLSVGMPRDLPKEKIIYLDPVEAAQHKAEGGGKR